jgi:putative glutamine amidotransferase
MSHSTNVPLVVLAADVKPIEGYTWHAAHEGYLNGIVHGLAGIPLILPSLGDAIDVDEVLPRVDGVLLPGSRSNVHPSCYGEPADPRAEPHDQQRDSVTLPLIQAALRHGVPMLCICRGMQELNVALGGTLISEVQDLAGRHDHRAPVSDDQTVRFAIRQQVNIEPGGMLAGIVGPGPIQVNSLHRQAVGRLAEGLAVEATAPDGTIEAVRVRDAMSFALGVQWHPEYWVRTDPPSAKIFGAFGNAIRERMARSEQRFTQAAE